MATESNVQSPEGVRTYRGRTLEEILPQIREELGPDAIILREREGLVGGVGGFFAQRFIEVEARRGDEPEGQPSASGSSIDIYDEDDEPGVEPDISARLQAPFEMPSEEPAERSEPRPFVPPELRRERIIPRDPQGEPTPSTRRFETDVFLERLRAASQMLPDEDEQPDAPAATTPLTPPSAPPAEPATPSVSGAEPATPGAPGTEPEPVEARAAEVDSADSAADAAASQAKPRRPARRTPPERKPRGSQPRRARPVRGSKMPRSEEVSAPPTPAETHAEAPASEPAAIDPWTTAMAALVAETDAEPPAPPRAAKPRSVARPETSPPHPAPSHTATHPSPASRNPYEDVRPRPPSLRAGLPTGPPVTSVGTPAAASTSAQTDAPAAASSAVTPLEIRGRRDGLLRSLVSRLFGGRLGASTLPKPSPAHAIDSAAAASIAAALTSRGASQAWAAQLISTAAAHGTALSDGLLAAAEVELARRIVPAPSVPATGAVVAFIGAGGTGKTRSTAALASAYSRASTLGVTVIAVDNPHGARELKRLLNGDGVPVLSLSGERARQAVTAYRQGGFVIVDTPTTTPTDPAAVEALGASLAPLELDATFVTLPATLGSQAARRALSSFGRLNPSAVAITHADETDQLAVVVEIAIAHRIPLAYVHAGTDHRSALSAVDAATLAQQLLAS